VTYFRPSQVTERFTAQTSFSDCGPCSAIMLANASAGRNVHPGTKGEVIGFRHDAGASWDGPTATDELAQGLRIRYNVFTKLALRFPAVWAELDPGKGAVLAGRLSRFPVTHHLRRWDPSYRGGHFVFVERMDTSNRVWWMDPLAPIAYKRGSSTVIYRGEWASASEVSTFLGGPFAVTSRSALVTSVAQVQEALTGPMLLLFEVEYTLASGSTLYQHPSVTAAQVGTTNTPHQVTSVGTPYKGSAIDQSWRAIHWSTGVPDGSAPSDRCVYVLSSNVSPL